MKKQDLIIILIAIAMMSSCNDDSLKLNRDLILGTWINTTNSDTLHITDQSNFFRSNEQMRYDHYDYELYTDSIKVGYSGRLFIAVRPTMHKYALDAETLKIDFDNRQCYGFELTKTIYTKLD